MIRLYHVNFIFISIFIMQKLKKISTYNCDRIVRELSGHVMHGKIIIIGSMLF